ncbi:uncharacterized protein LOC122503237 [Leptopilina heterotoma]|uniref:uncharacterized protein LOC122503237 n=1 Tax=Leptopilina heterotoma TaxID=63436 RepID=UPI001CA8C5C6|nr:uncharacterized protein LOC122503237 [Leptopilina heterotoma]
MRVNDKSVGAVFILMTKRTAALYTAVLRKLQMLCPNLKYGLKHVMVDFEDAIKLSIKRLFPNCKVHGCWFHSKKAIKKKWKNLGLRDADKLFLNMACCLALAPSGHYFRGIKVLKNKVNEYDRRFHKKNVQIP